MLNRLLLSIFIVVLSPLATTANLTAPATASVGSLTAPETIATGELAVVRSTAPATWTVYPSEYKSAIYVTDDGKTCVFASPTPGAVTFIAASVIDGEVRMTEKTLYNGVDRPDDVKPIPEPEPEPETVYTVVRDADVKASVSDFNALAESFETVVSGIDRGTIQTTTGARETLNGNWIRQAGRTNPDALTEFAELLDKLNKMVDYSSLSTVKTDYQQIITALQERAKKTESEAKAKAEPAKTDPIPASNCPDGKCNTRYYYYYR